MKFTFNNLKHAFTTALILQHFNPKLLIIVEANASNYVTARVLLQRDNNGILRPVAYYLKRINLAKNNYKIYNKELLAIV
jgi:hypothetical protein